jgi:ribonuclease HI
VRDAKLELNKAKTPRERSLPSKWTLRDIYGLIIPAHVEHELEEQRSRLEGQGPLEFYSDGSYFEDGPKPVSMAFGVVTMDQQTQRYRTVISGKTVGYASSTKAELVGLLATIMVCPRGTNATIYIDNEAVVQQFERLVENRETATARKRLRSPYAVWWAVIARAFEHQGRRIQVEWVKGHSGNPGNDMADIAAKEAHSKDAWSLDLSKHTDMKCHALFKGQLVEDDLRQVLKKQSTARVHQRWANQGRTQAWIKKWEEVEWRSTIAIVHSRKSPRSLFTSTADCAKRAHRIKKLHGSLPTGTYMHQWRPDLYEDSWCRICEAVKEDTTHVWRCPDTMESQKEGWEEAMSLVTEVGKKAWQQDRKKWLEMKKKAEEEGKEFTKAEPTFVAEDKETFWTMLERFFRGAKNIRQGNLMEDDLLTEEEVVVDLGALERRRWTVVEAYHGLAPVDLGDKFKEVFRTTQAIAAIMADRFITLIENYGRQGIWNVRCSKTVEWEKSVGITAVSKRARVGNPGTRVAGHGRSSGDYNSFYQDRTRVANAKELYKIADGRILKAYQGKLTLNAMERTGAIKYFLLKDLGT